MIYESETPTPYAVHCNGIDPECGAGPCNNGNAIFLTEEFYTRQMHFPNSRWKSPRCRGDAWWDDDIYEKALDDAETLQEKSVIGLFGLLSKE